MLADRLIAYLLPLVAAACTLLLLTLAWQDLRHRRLPNKWVAALGALYLLASPALASPLLPHLLVGLVTLLFAMVLTARGLMGGGDAKLICVLMLWAGPEGALATLFWITQFGLLLALLGFAAQKGLRRGTPRWLRQPLRCLTAKRGLPYGVALACGGLIAIASQLN
ncbi:A24 family peptidase [Paludibacterium purpuratum]|uniref:Prepilin peptidase CpaA n=1 Tax=Paludibacterium purpuratum TaxID=1144873 RepID=A0A4R7B6E0_9NEIS|nr:prepilin peptidase [Paludibacterium purpuratum]TDR80250.1 prepilin peptidase CpaA [Paludibacterium purpuratum]